jgi:hypothetical protein
MKTTNNRTVVIPFTEITSSAVYAVTTVPSERTATTSTTAELTNAYTITSTFEPPTTKATGKIISLPTLMNHLLTVLQLLFHLQ